MDNLKQQRNKSTWPKGAWCDEVDQLGWIDAETGYACAINRVMHSGHLCGYVEIPKGHPLYGDDYSARITKKPTRELFGGWYLIDDNYDSAGGLFTVHGGVTYTGNGDFFSNGDGYWYGFDCGHAGDISPAIQYEGRYMSEGVYRDMEYVKAQTTALAAQLKQIAGV